ncbi:MAG: beta-ribofuranosylaminobenzene 5'-phosphate synthase family protein [bacterium]
MIRIKSPSRLHFGQLDLNGDSGRIYGGSGVALKEPSTLIYMEKSSELKVEGENSAGIKKILLQFLEKIKKRGLINKKAGVLVKVERLLPAHNGLGSGTQSALTLAEGINRLYNLNLNNKMIAEMVDRRHSRSAVGFGAFYQGGFIVDGGRPTEDKENDEYLPPIIYQHQVPENWHFIVVLPFYEKDKMAGEKEIKTFKNLKQMRLEKCQENCHNLLLGMLPALQENNIKKFSEHLNKIEDNVGDYFAEIQGGRYTSDLAAEMIMLMEEEGVYARGQSSWGPAVYGLVRAREKAENIEFKLRKKFGNDIRDIYISTTANRGAEISINV